MAGLDDAQRQTPVPATPQWTVHEVFAHLVGGASDAASGRVDGAPGDQWTARHVAERRHRTVDDLLAEWDRVGPAVEASLSDDQIYGPNLAADVICHEGDLREALGLTRADREHWQPFLDVMMLYLRKQLRHNTTVIVCDESGQEWTCGSGQPSTRLQSDGYELMRALYSRRSQRQVAAWDWTPAPPADVTQHFGVFGTRDDDQPLPVTGR